MIRTLVIFTLAVPAFADEALLACRAVADVQHRVACYDRLADFRYPRQAPGAAGDRAAGPFPAQPSDEPGATANNVAIERPDIAEPAKPKAGQTAATSEQSTQQPLKPVEAFGKRRQAPETRTAISATVRGVSKSPYNKLIISLDNGQVWRQLDSTNLRIQPGDGVTIRSASFNSYLLSKQSGSKSIRVKRAD